MFNEILWFLMMVTCFLTIILIYKKMGKLGLVFWIVIATIISNIQTIKLINLFGLETSLGTILYGTTFLVTDIINLKYGPKEAQKSIFYGLLAMIMTSLLMSICLIYIPSQNDFANESLKLIFTFNARITIASLLSFVVSQTIDTWLFNWLQKKYNKLWLSNNGSTLFCQIIDTVLFTLITYIGTINTKALIEIMISMYLFKLIIAILDTPFIYIANKIKKVHEE